MKCNCFDNLKIWRGGDINGLSRDWGVHPTALSKTKTKYQTSLSRRHQKMGNKHAPNRVQIHVCPTEVVFSMVFGHLNYVQHTKPQKKVQNSAESSCLRLCPLFHPYYRFQESKFHVQLRQAKGTPRAGRGLHAYKYIQISKLAFQRQRWHSAVPDYCS